MAGQRGMNGKTPLKFRVKSQRINASGWLKARFLSRLDLQI